MEKITSWYLKGEFSTGVWTEFTNDVMIAYGIDDTFGQLDDSPINLVAPPRTLKFVLDNSPFNSGSARGYYHPGHTNCRSGFTEGMQVEYGIVYNGTTQKIFLGKVHIVLPTPGMWGEQISTVTCVTWADKAQRTRVAQVAALATKRVDEAATTLLTYITDQPNATDFETGASTFASVFDMERSERDTVWAILSKLIRSEFGRSFEQGGTTSGNVLRIEDRRFRIANLTSLGTLDNSFEGFEPEYSDLNGVDAVEVTIWPRVVGAALEVVANLGNIMELLPGETKEFVLYYRDPSGGGRIRAQDIQTPVASTDFKFGVTGDGVGEALNASLTITLTKGTDSSLCSVTNAASVSGYINKFNLRAYAIRTNDPLTLKAGSGDIVLKYEMPYEDNSNVAQGIADYLYSKLKRSANYTRVKKITFMANYDATHMLAALTGWPSTRWTIEEDQTGITGDWFVNGGRRKLGIGGRIDMEWAITPASNEVYWVLGVSELGVDTKLAI